LYVYLRESSIVTRAAFLIDATRTPIGRYGGVLSAVRPDDLAAVAIRALAARFGQIDWATLDEVLLGNANQAGEDNRNVARMALLLAGLPKEVPGATINRLCGSGMDALGMAARAVQSGQAEMILAGGVESMSRAPFVLSKSETPFARNVELFDTTIGWRFVNPLMKSQYGVDSMGETAENVAEDYGISRADQDAFALRSQQRALAAQKAGRFEIEITPVSIAQKKGDPVAVARDEHPRDTSLEALAKLGTPFRKGGSVTAGNASGVNDGACAVLIAGEEAIRRYDLTPLARVLGHATAGVAPRVMGIGPLPASRKILGRLGLTVEQMDVIELNEAFAAQALAVLRELGVADDAAHVNPNGGAIALGHPLGMSGARIVASAAFELRERKARYALATMCIGVGQGIATVLERV